MSQSYVIGKVTESKEMLSQKYMLNIVCVMRQVCAAVHSNCDRASASIRP